MVIPFGSRFWWSPTLQLSQTLVTTPKQQGFNFLSMDGQPRPPAFAAVNPYPVAPT
jgi:hypothetical protein